MALDELKLTLNPSSDNLQYRITLLQAADLRSNKEAFGISLPGAAANQNILLGVNGMQADIQIRFMIHDDGTDKADGTYAPGGTQTDVTTIEEQIAYLEDEIHAPDFAASWTLDDLSGTRFEDDDVFLETVDVPIISRESPKWREARLALRRGQSIG